MYLFICFNAIGGTGSSGSRSDKRCSMFLLAYTGGKTVLLQTLAKEGDDVLVGGI